MDLTDLNDDTSRSRPRDMSHEILVAWALCPRCGKHMCRECGCACHAQGDGS